MTRTANTDYAPIHPNSLPAGLIWTTPAHEQGQPVSDAYATPGHITGDAEGALYRRRTDSTEPVSSSRRVRYFRRVGPRWID